MRRVTRKWRPSLAFVLAGALAGTLFIALVGLVVLRYLGPEIGFQNAALLIATVIALLTTFCGYLLVRLLLRPIRSLAQYAKSIREGDVDGAVPPNRFGTQEIGAMGKAVIDMAEAARTREATVRSFSDHITHELKTPVSVIVAAAEMLEDQPAGDLDPKLVSQIAAAASQMNTQLDALRHMARAREADYRGKCRLQDVLPGLMVQFDTLEIDPAGAHQTLPMAPDGVRLVLEHLFENAAQHGARKVILRVDTSGVLTLQDDGSGIPDADAPKVFEPLYTTRRDNGGTGMGLAIVKTVLSAHGGQIALVPCETGTQFLVRFANV